MSHMFRRATLRLSPIVRTGPGQACRRQSPLHLRFEPAIIPLSCRRTYAKETSPEEEDAAAKATELSQRAVEREERLVTSGTSAQAKENDRPWQRESSSAQPESTSPDPSKGDRSKGRLLTTPTRLLKLILPMPFHPEQEHINEPVEGKNKNDIVEPLALLVHPQQPLSYLERLIQAEIPTLKHNGREKLPDIVFRAEADHEESKRKTEKKKEENNNNNDHTNVAAYSGLGHEGPKRKAANWVRWSGSTEVGDFIRDAARGREFALDIEGFDQEVRVAVPSFRDRTHYMRVQLRKMSRDINGMSKIKNECDELAHKGAHRLAQGGFAALGTWWGIVYYVTFHTEMGWDLVEPVTYLVGLTTIMGGYIWFLYISRDLSYKAAMNLTVSRRQNVLYQLRGFDQHKWEQVVHEANALRKEIKIIAAEYDADWDEAKDLGSEEVMEVLEEAEEEKKDSKKEGKDKAKEDTKKEAKSSEKE